MATSSFTRYVRYVTRCALLLALVPPSGGLSGQQINWDLEAGSLRADAITGGDNVVLAISGTRPGCWVYRVKVELIEEMSDLTPFVQLLGYAPLSTPGSERPAGGDPPGLAPVGTPNPYERWSTSVDRLEAFGQSSRTVLCYSASPVDATGLHGTLERASAARQQFEGGSQQVPADSVSALRARHRSAEEMALTLLEFSKSPRVPTTASILTRPGTTGVRFTIEATARQGLGLEETPKTYTGTVRMRPKYRVVTGVGWMFSGIRSGVYRRTDIPVAATDSTPAGTKRAFVRDDSEAGVAQAPMVQVGWYADMDRWLGAGVSTGVGVRTLGEETAPEFFLGVSALLSESLMLSMGAHLGRVQTLASEIRDFEGSLPESIQDDAVVGVDWAVAFAISVAVVIR